MLVDQMQVSDAHADALMRMYDEDASFDGPSNLAASAAQLSRGGVRTQVFAIFTRPNHPNQAQWDAALKQIDLFYRKIVATGRVVLVAHQSQLSEALRSEKIAGLLSLEGGGGLDCEPHRLRILHRLGVRGIGLTWNYANALADGCREQRNGGLTRAGRELIKEVCQLGMWIDVAHLSDQGVRDVFHMTDSRVMASHANCRAVYEHPRNLLDDDIREIIRRNGFMGLTFEASFVGTAGSVSVDQLLLHLDHVLELGGSDCVGFGSDFDGTSAAVPELTDASDYARLTSRLVDRYGKTLAKKVLSENFNRYLHLALPY